MTRLDWLMTTLNHVIGHEPNDLESEWGEGDGRDDLAAVIYVYKDGKVSWYAEQ